MRDPAYEGDNFAVVVLEVMVPHRRLPYMDIQASDHKQRLRDGVPQNTTIIIIALEK